ncbi:MAG: hypothetical protein EA352_10875 [Gemmatimonadales bacterium]|nr:MAG: hypothetical protein EA352_10875 [Gemmatimonadales bacterium]
MSPVMFRRQRTHDLKEVAPTDRAFQNFRDGLLITVFCVISAVGLLTGCDSPDDGDPQEPTGAPTFQELAQVDAEELDSLTMGVAFHLGDPDAPVSVVEFSDFTCPVCAAFHKEDFSEIAVEFVDNGLVRWRYVPVVMTASQQGIDASLAAMCAAEGSQEEFWDAAGRVYAAHDDWMAEADPRPILKQIVAAPHRANGSESEQFDECVAERRPLARLEAGNAQARALRLRATPTFFIDGRIIPGRPPLDVLRSFLAAAVSERQR